MYMALHAGILAPPRTTEINIPAGWPGLHRDGHAPGAAVLAVSVQRVASRTHNPPLSLSMGALNAQTLHVSLPLPAASRLSTC